MAIALLVILAGIISVVGCQNNAYRGRDSPMQQFAQHVANTRPSNDRDSDPPLDTGWKYPRIKRSAEDDHPKHNIRGGVEPDAPRDDDRLYRIKPAGLKQAYKEHADRSNIKPFPNSENSDNEDNPWRLSDQHRVLNRSRLPEHNEKRLSSSEQSNNLRPASEIGFGVNVQWDWTSFVLNYAEFIIPEQKIRRAPVSTQGQPWPMPQYFTQKLNKTFILAEDDFSFKLPYENCDILNEAVKRYRTYIFSDSLEDAYDNIVNAAGSRFERRELKYQTYRFKHAAYIKGLTIMAQHDCPDYPYLGMDESCKYNQFNINCRIYLKVQYELVIKKKSAYLFANEVWGILRGLETFSQLIFKGINGKFYISDTVISDYPRFTHRGVLLDTARHFIFKDVIYDALEGMAQNKMNVLHWHIVDDQSFPYKSRVFPEFSDKGAFHPTMVYTHEDIADIIEFARLRGIRVMPEFDNPGHTNSWGYGKPELLTPCYQGTYPVKGFMGPILPTRNTTYKILKDLFNEVLDVFHDEHIHLGGDEVPLTCWQSNPEVMEFSNKLQSMVPTLKYSIPGDMRLVLDYYVKRVTGDIINSAKSKNKNVTFVMWQEVLNNDIQLPNDTIIQVWMGGMADVQRAIMMGYKVIYSTCWYLDLIDYGTKWPKYYQCDPVDNNEGFHIEEDKILGGEACLWAEYIDNENLMTMLWPRASATAERLWSSKDVKDLDKAAARLQEHRCRMLSRGLSVGQISGPDYCLRRKKREHDFCPRCEKSRKVVEDTMDFKVHMQERQTSLADCNSTNSSITDMVLSQGSSVVIICVLAVIVAMMILQLTKGHARGSSIMRPCNKRTIFVTFITLVVVYFMCYTTIWMRVLDVEGSYQQRFESNVK